MRESRQWLGITCGTIVVALVWIVFGQYVPSEPSPIAVEIIGTVIGVLMGIAMAETLRHEANEMKGRKLQAKLLGELRIAEAILRDVTGGLQINRPYWDSALTTGIFALLNEEAQNDLVIVHECITWYNHEARRMDSFLSQYVSPDRDRMIQTMRNSLNRMRVEAHEKILKTLRKHKLTPNRP